MGSLRIGTTLVDTIGQLKLGSSNVLAVYDGNVQVFPAPTTTTTTTTTTTSTTTSTTTAAPTTTTSTTSTTTTAPTTTSTTSTTTTAPTTTTSTTSTTTTAPTTTTTTSTTSTTTTGTSTSTTTLPPPTYVDVSIYDNNCQDQFTSIVVNPGGTPIIGEYYRFDANVIYLVTGFTYTTSPNTFTFTGGVGNCLNVPP